MWVRTYVTIRIIKCVVTWKPCIVARFALQMIWKPFILSSIESAQDHALQGVQPITAFFPELTAGSRPGQPTLSHRKARPKLRHPQPLPQPAFRFRSLCSFFSLSTTARTLAWSLTPVISPLSPFISLRRLHRQSASVQFSSCTLTNPLQVSGLEPYAYILLPRNEYSSKFRYSLLLLVVCAIKQAIDRGWRHRFNQLPIQVSSTQPKEMYIGGVKSICHSGRSMSNTWSMGLVKIWLQNC